MKTNPRMIKNGKIIGSKVTRGMPPSVAMPMQAPMAPAPVPTLPGAEVRTRSNKGLLPPSTPAAGTQKPTGKQSIAAKKKKGK
jgi:hypothetical protein